MARYSLINQFCRGHFKPIGLLTKCSSFLLCSGMSSMINLHFRCTWTSGVHVHVQMPLHKFPRYSLINQFSIGHLSPISTNDTYTRRETFSFMISHLAKWRPYKVRGLFSNPNLVLVPDPHTRRRVC